MPYNANSLLTLGGLKTYAQKVKQEADTLASRVTALEGAGAQANVLESVKVNGVALAIAQKARRNRLHSPCAYRKTERSV